MSMSNKEIVQAMATEFARILGKKLRRKVSANQMAEMIVEVFGKAPTTGDLSDEIRKKRDLQRLPAAINDALETDQVDVALVRDLVMDTNQVVSVAILKAEGYVEGESYIVEEEDEDDELSGPEWVEKHLGAKLPKTLKQVYENREQDELEDIIVDEDDLYISVTEFNSLSANGYRSVWPGTEGMLILAYDGAGNSYVAKPQEKFKHVYFYDHETTELWRVGVSVPGFIKKLREYKTVKEPAAPAAGEARLGKWKAVSSSTHALKKLDFIPL